MNAGTPQMVRKRGERGYALLVVIFLVTVLLLSTMVVATNILTEGRREKEKEMIWRGNQYARGVKLHFRKTGRFPTTLDDLTKPKIGNIRFMRQAYKDPMNKEDGSWRLIYVGPAGNLIGSLNPSLNSVQMPAAQGQPNASGTGPIAIGGQSGIGGLGPASNTPSAPGTSQATPGTGSTAGTTITGTGVPGTDPTATGTDSQAV